MEGTVLATTASPRDVWTCFLLLASLRHSGNTHPVRVACQRIKRADRQLLEQFVDVTCFEYRGPAPLLKVRTLSSLDAAVAIWIDPDYLVTDLLAACYQHAQLSWRSSEEMQDYARERLWDPCSELTLIPDEILAVWRQDVGERDEAAISHLCSLRAFSIPQQQAAFLKRWEQLICRLLARSDQYLLPDSVAYAQVDEASFNALLAFLDEAPTSCSGTLHQSLLPAYQRRTHLAALVETLQWASSCAYQFPEMPRKVRRLTHKKRS